MSVLRSSIRLFVAADSLVMVPAMTRIITKSRLPSPTAAATITMMGVVSIMERRQAVGAVA